MSPSSVGIAGVGARGTDPAYRNELMASCPKCGRHPVRKRAGVRQCRHCGVLGGLALILELMRKKEEAA